MCVSDVACILVKNSTSSAFGTNTYLRTHTQTFLEIRYSMEEKIWRDAEVMWGDIFFLESGGLGSRVSLSGKEDCAESFSST